MLVHGVEIYMQEKKAVHGDNSARLTQHILELIMVMSVANLSRRAVGKLPQGSIFL